MNIRQNPEPDFYDIFDYHLIPWWQTTWFKITALVLALALLGLILYLVLRRKKRELTSWEWAEQKIKQFSLEKYTTKDDFKKFYFDITLVLKQYLQKRYGWKTEDKTDEELVNFLDKQGFKTRLLDDLKKMLEGAVWVKFAGEDVIKTQAEADLKTALLIVRQTVPVEEKIKTSK